jgi:hypothetical protein
MTYGDFAWKDVMDRSANATRRVRRHVSAPFIAGEPAPFMDDAESDWAWQVSRVIKTPLICPHLDFVVTSFVRYGRRFALDDLAKPVIDTVTRHPRSMWVRVEHGDSPGVRVSEVAPPFPPHIHHMIELPVLAERANVSVINRDLASVAKVAGSSPVGVHLTVGPVDLRELGFGGPVRILFDALAQPLGGDDRIIDLRVVRGSSEQRGTEIRMWMID